jgi:hypothetical protein
MCTIHQPSIFLFQMFDQLLLLKRGGETVFFGDLGPEASRLISYFYQFPNTPKLTNGANPATWMLEVIGAGTSSVATSDYAALYRDSSLHSINEDEVKRLLHPLSKKAPLEFDSEFATGFRTQFRELVTKYRNVYYRTPSYNFTRVMVGILVAAVFGSVYYDGAINDVSDLQSRISMIFVTTQFNGIINLSSVLPVMALERDAFYRERAAKTYGVEAYAMATGLVELPYIITTCLMFLAVFYFSCSLDLSAEAFFKYALTYGLVISMFTFFGQFLSAALPNTQTAQVIGSASSGLFNIFGGLFIAYSNIPSYWSFAYWITPIHYVLESLTASQFARDESVAYEINDVDVTVGALYASIAPDFKYTRFGEDIFVLCLFMLTFRLFTYLALKYINHLAR